MPDYRELARASDPLPTASDAPKIRPDSRHTISVSITADEYEGEPYTDEDLLAAVTATLHEVFPFDDGYPVVPTVEGLIIADRSVREG